MVYYLDPEFDPKKLTKAELRSIMASNGILDLPPPSAKKDELLELFNKEIVAKRKTIIESQKNIKAKSDGIVFLDESSRPSPKKPKKSKQPKQITTDTTRDIEQSPSPVKENEKAIPETPLNVSTYKLVSRLENLQGKKEAKRKEVENNGNLILLKSLSAISAIVVIITFIYFKYWFMWPIYTNDQFNALEQKPVLFLKCPYPKNSLIGSCSDGKLYCASGYIKRRNWLGFGSSCIIDKERLSLIQSIKKKIVFELQIRLGFNQCYNLSSPAISKTKLHDIILNYFKSMKLKTFSEYFDICLRSLIQEGTQIEELQSDHPVDEGNYYKAKEPIFTYYCRIKISIRNLLQERPFEVISGIFLAFLSTIIIFQYNAKRMQRKLVRNYYLLICKILKEQSAQHRSDPAVPSFISTNQLRDAVLIKSSSREKNVLWSKIMGEVSKNSNIVESITIFRGEQTRVWEWIGADVSL